MTPSYVDLNCDVGESFGPWTLGADAAVMPYITSANIACGYHGGDPRIMRKSVELALAHRVAIGAHPGLPDRTGLGHRTMDVSAGEVKDYVCYQVGALREFVRVAGGDLQHVLPHGMLYHMIEKDESLAMAAVEAVIESGGTQLILMASASGEFACICRRKGVRVASEGFADRAYNVDGTLVSRKLPDSLITDPQRAADRAVRMAIEGKVRTIDGVDINVSVQTIGCHSDTPGAERIVPTVREALEKAGLQVRPLRDWLPRAGGCRE
ncbi:MAG: LamB/YcsF family protein [Candidatus Rokubacteria bacterium]|nr:LamB/YcsF family protein [Candidatus Rokubacteria bacterium]